jgi:hypothetical protein
MLSRTRQTKKYAEVNANTLDNLLELNGINQVNWIKIDVEGAEFEVLKGATKTLSHENISLLIEIHNVDDSRHYDNVIDFLKHNNYEVAFEESYHDRREGHVIFHKRNNNDNSRNSIGARALI